MNANNKVAVITRWSIKLEEDSRRRRRCGWGSMEEIFIETIIRGSREELFILSIQCNEMCVF